MKATQALHELGQSLWIDDITRDMLDSGTLKKYIDDFSVTGLTSNPTIFDNAISKSDSYDPEIKRLMKAGYTGEALFFELALQDLSRAADLFLPIHQKTATVDGFVSLEVSPLLAYDTQATIAEAKRLYARAHKSNLFIKIPGTKEGLPAIEEAIFSGVTVNVTLLFSADDCNAAADAYMKGLERRVAAGLDPDVRSVASIFISRWDKAVMDKAPDNLRDKLGVAVAHQAYRDYRAMLDTDRWQRLESYRRAAAAPPLRQHQHQGPPRRRHSIYICACGAKHGQHHAGQDAARLCRPRQAERRSCPGRRRLRGGAGGLREGRHLCFSAGRAAPEGRRRVLRVVVAGSAEIHRHQDQSAELEGGRPMSTQLIDTPAWQALSAHHAKIKDAHLRQLFADDPGRAARFTVEGAGLSLDYSKNRITEETVGLLVNLAKERKVAERRDAMFRGEKINVSENRAVLHVALRAPRDEVIEVDGHNVVPDVHDVLDRMAAFAEKVGAARGPGTRASASRTSSISASAAPISARRWPISRSAPTPIAT